MFHAAVDLKTLLRLAWGSPRRAATTSAICAAVLLVVTLALSPLQAVGGLLLPWLPLGAFVRQYPNETKQGVGWLLGKLSWASTSIEREGVRQDLEGTLSIGVQQLGDICGEDIPTKVRFQFLRTGEEVESLQDGTLVVSIARHTDRTRNLVTAAFTFVRRCVLVDARLYLDEDVSQGLDFVLTKALLASGNDQAVRTFFLEIWKPAIAGKERLRGLTEKLDELFEHRLVGSILIPEFVDLPSRSNRFPTRDLALETAAFVEYLHELATRELGQTTSEGTSFSGGIIRARVIFVARPEVYQIKGPAPHRQAVEWSIARAYRHIYLVGTSRNLEYVREVASGYIDDTRISSIEESVSKRLTPSGRSLEQIVVRLSVDVRLRTGIGREPYVVVGPDGEANLRRVLKARGARIN